MQPESNAVMIESSFLSNSLWSPDPLETFDLDTVSYNSPFDFDEPRLDYNDIDSASFDLSSIDIYSNDLDCMPLDFSSDFQISELVNEVICEDGDFSLTSLEFSADEKEDELKPEEIKSNYDNFTKADERFQDAVKCLMDRKFWSKRSSSEQSLTLDALSFLFTYHLSIQNQVDVMTILHPKIHFRPDDEEFSINESDISDLKLWKIRAYLKKNVPGFKDFGLHTKKKTSSTESSKKSNCKLTRRKSNLNYSRTKRKQKAKNKKKELEQVEPKEPNDNFKIFTQTEKEMKSGFFVYEKKLKLCTSSTEEDEDINVLE